MLILILPVITAVQIEYSTDNSTWENVTYVNETNNESYQINLHEDTLYYFRGRYNSSTDWIYNNVTTSTSQEDEFMNISIILGLGFVAFLFLYLAFNLDKKEHFLLKLLLMFFALIICILIPSALINGTSSTQVIFFKVVMGFFVIFVTYIFIYFIYTIYLKGKLIKIGMIKQKKLKRGKA